MGCLEIKWRGLILVPTKEASDELYRLNMTILDVKSILESGYGCSESRRNVGKYEMCVDMGKITKKVVVAKGYNIFRQREVWVILHVDAHPRKSGRNFQKSRDIQKNNGLKKGYLEGFWKKE